MIRVLIVEDSPVEQALLTHIFNSDPGLHVVGIAGDGEEAFREVQRLKPDIVTMDIHMPKLNGFETTRRIMEQYPLPIVVVSGSTTTSHEDKTFRALDAGALAVVRKPRGIGTPGYAEDVKELVRTVKIMSEVKVVRRWQRAPRETCHSPPLPEAMASREIRVVAIGSSTGGPAVLRTILSALPGDFAAPLLVVQHMSAGFIEGFAAWLTTVSGFPSRIASHGDFPLPGRAYFPPDGCHMEMGRDGRIVLSRDLPDNGLRPSVARLFHSVAETFGRNALGVLLTGMGRDGADELKLLKEKGAVTVAQDRESSVINGMPGEAVRLGAAEFVLPPGDIARLLARLVKPTTSFPLTPTLSPREREHD